MANISLPSAGSQARVIAPITPAKEQPTALQQVINSIPSLANSVIRGMQVQQNAEELAFQKQQQADLNTQALEDKTTITSAIADVNTMMAARESARLAETSLQSLSVDVNRAFADGDISSADKQLQETFISTFDKVKTARNQGLLDDNSFSIKAREAKQKFLAEYPHLGEDIDKIFNVATGRRASSTTGAAAQKQLQFNRNMESKYGIGYTPQDVLVEQAKMSQAEGIKRNKELGVVNFGQIISDSNSALNLGIDSIMQSASTAYSSKQALDQNELDSLNGKIEQIKRAIVRGIDEEVAGLRAQGQVVDPAAVRAQKEFSIEQLNSTQNFVNDKDLQKMLAKRNDTEKAMWQAGLGGEITKLNSIAGLLGNGGLTALSGFIGAATPAQERVIASLAGEAGLAPEALANTKQLVMDAASRVANPIPVPGFEKLDAFYGLGAMKGGETSDVVQHNTLRNLDKLVVNPQDVSGAVSQLNDPKVSANYATGSTETKNELVQTTNGWEAMLFSEIQDNGYSVVFDNQTQQLVVSRPQPTLTSTGFSTVAGIGAGPTSSDVSSTKIAVNRGLTKSMNELLSAHSNPNYTGILQAPLPWISDVTNLLQPKPIIVPAQ